MVHIDDLKRAALRAAEEIKEVCLRGKVTSDLKADKSPVSTADLAANAIIIQELSSRYPGIPIIAEESEVPPYHLRKNWSQFFLVDPLDGTKDFLCGSKEFTVNIAYLEKNKPVMGVVCAPLLEKLYYADRTKAFLEVDGETYQLPLIPEIKTPLNLVITKSHLNEATKDFLKRIELKVPEINTISIGSSLKFCLLAEGVADLYPRMGKMSEWDCAAAHAILLRSGCQLIDYESRLPVTYNKESLEVNSFLAYKTQLEDQLFKMLE